MATLKGRLAQAEHDAKAAEDELAETNAKGERVSIYVFPSNVSIFEIFCTEHQLPIRCVLKNFKNSQEKKACDVIIFQTYRPTLAT